MNRRYKPVAEINVVPYIDVMLVLLVIFMVTAPLLTQGVVVELPRAQSESLPENSEPPIILSVDLQGDYFLNIASDPEQALTAVAVASEVQAALRVAPERIVLVKADHQVAYGQVVVAMVILQQAGAPSVGLMTQSPDSAG